MSPSDAALHGCFSLVPPPPSACQGERLAVHEGKQGETTDTGPRSRTRAHSENSTVKASSEPTKTRPCLGQVTEPGPAQGFRPFLH